MEQVSSAVNLRHAYKRGRANGGATGIDPMPVEELQDWLAANQITLAASLLDGRGATLYGRSLSAESRRTRAASLVGGLSMPLPVKGLPTSCHGRGDECGVVLGPGVSQSAAAV